MKIRPARTEDAKVICDLINHYAERGRMLHRSLESAYDHLRDFHVVENDDGAVVGCVAVDVFWGDLAEVKSLAVRADVCGRGMGARLLEVAVDDTREIGVNRLFTLTYEREFFERRGFEIVDRQTLPEKVWRECIACPKANVCDEIAMILEVNFEETARRK